MMWLGKVSILVFIKHSCMREFRKVNLVTADSAWQEEVLEV